MKNTVGAPMPNPDYFGSGLCGLLRNWPAHSLTVSRVWKVGEREGEREGARPIRWPGWPTWAAPPPRSLINRRAGGGVGQWNRLRAWAGRRDADQGSRLQPSMPFKACFVYHRSAATWQPSEVTELLAGQGHCHAAVVGCTPVYELRPLNSGRCSLLTMQACVVSNEQQPLLSGRCSLHSALADYYAMSSEHSWSLVAAHYADHVVSNALHSE
eukprot:Gb_15776 [translate_table: standard]